MIKITDDIRREVINYLDIDIYNDDEYNEYPDDFYSFYYRCMKANMHYADADRYAILNTLFNYDIGMENAMAIDTWMYENDEGDIYDIMATNEEDKLMLKKAVMELGLNLDFSGWTKEDYTAYEYFEDDK